MASGSYPRLSCTTTIEAVAYRRLMVKEMNGDSRGAKGCGEMQLVAERETWEERFGLLDVQQLRPVLFEAGDAEDEMQGLVVGDVFRTDLHIDNTEWDDMVYTYGHLWLGYSPFDRSGYNGGDENTC